MMLYSENLHVLLHCCSPKHVSLEKIHAGLCSVQLLSQNSASAKLQIYQSLISLEYIPAL